MAEEKKIEQPGIELQKLASSLMEQEPETISVLGHKHTITWLKKRTVRKFSHIMLKEKDPWKRNVKVCACVLLNSRNGLATWFLLHFWYMIYWRWLYYVKDIDQVEIVGVLSASKKKIQSEPLAVATILSTAMMDTMMMMARHEVGQAEQAGVQPMH
ncbi:hypothetical protein [Prevotella sp. E2-28]|uniref:hypothetical protein n=1 Tax=Prevotella sp. E2-28 TaxID=2913620 RepID=UPI001EDB5A51|nr:hypothetical protein [Prevotella sp. E2-28]UKK52663.1 hypothetical protein L6465_08595 [Prevotella sp. E2-28]